MNKVLFVLGKLPYPLERDGVSLINLRLIRECIKKYDCDILILEDISDELIIQFCDQENFSGIVYKNKISRNIFLRRLGIIVNTFLGIQDVSIFSKLDINLSDYSMLYYCAPPIVLNKFLHSVDIPLFINAVDCFTLLNLRFFQQDKKIYSFLKYKFYSYFEPLMLRDADIVNFVSTYDSNFAIKRLNIKNSISIRNGVDLSFFSGINYKDSKSLLFVGNYNYKPNVDAVNYFVSEILPSLRVKYPNLILYVVGPNSAFEFDDSNIIVTGFVEDIREYYSKSAIFVSPLLTGAGVKNKILEAMAAGLPVVATKISVDGIENLDHGKNILIAKTTEEFINITLSLLDDSEQRKFISKNSMDLMNNGFSWSSTLSSYLAHIDNLIK